jgi:xanthine dehydrogenase accessory factor
MTSSDDQLAIASAIESALLGGPMVVVATVTATGEPPLLPLGAKLMVTREGDRTGSLGLPALDDAAAATAEELYTAFPRIAVETLYVGADGRTTTRRHESRPGDAELMLQLWEAPARLVIVGGGHIGLALATFGEQLGFAVTVIDDREDFASRERFPMAEDVRAGDIGAHLDAIELDPTTHVVLVSRGHQQDEMALRHSVGRGAAFVGMIGSRRRTATVRRHLLDDGYDPADLDQVSTPIGLDIGAETPEEIAISILAEIVMLRRGGTGARMRDGRPHLE